MYAITDASVGYILFADIYTGKNPGQPSTVSSIVEKLSKNYFHKGHTIYMDRFYTSTTLLKNLFQKKTLAVGTVQKNRKRMPTGLIHCHLNREEATYRRDGCLLCVKWKDKRGVYLLSTKHDFQLVPTHDRKNPKKVKIKPSVVADYNLYKTGVDRHDQMVSYYPFHQKTVKWWKKLFFHLLIMCIINSHILFKNVTGQNLSLREFMIKLGSELLLKAGHIMVSDCNTEAASANRLIGRHFAIKLVSETKKHPAQRCKVCCERAKNSGQTKFRKETVYICE